MNCNVFIEFWDLRWFVERGVRWRVINLNKLVFWIN